ncbi:MAG: hypothetical protein AMXMBFR82_05500 [Candidatus Hydrogenedentota bacterium]
MKARPEARGLPGGPFLCAGIALQDDHWYPAPGSGQNGIFSVEKEVKDAANRVEEQNDETHGQSPNVGFAPSVPIPV